VEVLSQVWENDTKKVIVNKVKRIVNAVNHVKVFGERQRHNISCIAFSGQIILVTFKRFDHKENEYIVKAVPVYGQHVQTMRGSTKHYRVS